MSAKFGYFGQPLKPKTALAKQPKMAEKINMIADVLEGITGVGNIRIHKTTNPRQWMLEVTGSGGGGEGLPEGFEVVENAVVEMRWHTPDDEDGTTGKYELQVKRGTILAKDVDEEWQTLMDFRQFDA